jgi:hypothetical protein
MAETPHAPVPAAPAVAPEAPPRAASVPGRLGIGVNVFLQVLLSLVILAAVNYLGFQYYWRWDLSPSQDHTLSSSTTNFLRKNSKEIKITALFVRGSPVNDNLRSLLEEYRRNGKKLVKVDFLDPSRDIAQAEKLKMEAGVELSQNGLLVQANKRTRFIPEEEIVMKLKQTGSTQPSLIFRGEDAVTSAIIGLIEGGVRTFHFLSGKGARGDAATKDALDGLHELGRQQNFQVDLINLAEVSAIPERSSGLIIVGPRYDITEREMQIIGDFWQRKKSGLLILLDPDAETPRLGAFLSSVGVTPRKDRVLVAESTSTGPAKVLEVQAEFSKDTVITRALSESTSVFSGQTQSLSLRLDDPKLQEQSITVVPLVQAAKRFWGETSYLDQIPVADEKDALPPVVLAAAVERGATLDQAVRSESSRMVVVGNASLFDRRAQLAVDRDFIAASLNWMISREKLIGEAPKQKSSYRVQLSDHQHQLVFWITAMFMPAAVLGFGFIIWAVRRSA